MGNTNEMNVLSIKKLARALYRDPEQEHPELEARIDNHIAAMTRFGIYVSFLFWPLIALMGYFIELSAVRLAMIFFASLAFMSSVIFFKVTPNLRAKIALVFYVFFPGVIAFYVSVAFQKVFDVNQTYYILKDGVQYLHFTQDQFLQYVGMFDRLLSINIYYSLSLVFIAIAPIKFRNVSMLVVPYALYGIVAFSSAAKPGWLIVYMIILGVGVTIKATAEFLVVEAIRRRLVDEAEVKRMSRALVDRELELARDIQQSVPVPEQIVSDHFEIEFFLKPNELVGGDWIAVREEKDGSIWILLIDAVGKGMQAALVVHAVQSLWTSADRDQLDAEGWITLVNETLMRMGQKSLHCVTLGLMHLQSNSMIYWSAAHCPVLMRAETNGKVVYQELQARGGMIGLAKDLNLIPSKLDLNSFDDIHLILCSDGLLSILPGSRQREETLPMLEEDFTGTLSGMSADDDVAVVSIRRHKKIGGRKVG
jgi:serine phosphatase RsbU (regulator of sigma subunit)